DRGSRCLDRPPRFGPRLQQVSDSSRVEVVPLQQIAPRNPKLEFAVGDGRAKSFLLIKGQNYARNLRTCGLAPNHDVDHFFTCFLRSRPTTHEFDRAEAGDGLPEFFAPTGCPGTSGFIVGINSGP